MKPVKGLVLFLLLIVIQHANAQDNLDELLQKNIKDGEKLIGGYIGPFMKLASQGMNQGWYNTAKPHKLGGFDLTFTVNAMFVPSDELFFDVSKLGLSSVAVSNTGEYYPSVPTAFGPKYESQLKYYADGVPADYYQRNGNVPQQPDGSFYSPQGLDLKGELGANLVPLPMAQLGLGLPKGTEIKVRYTPTINIGDDAKVQLLGFGIMHDVKQWIPGIKMLPFDLSAFVGYTRLKFDAEFDNDPQGNPQTGLFELNSTTIQGLISKKFSVITFYGGIGYNIARSELAMRGWYDVDDDQVRDAVEVNPINLNFSSTGPRATAGFRLKLGILTLHTDYTLQRYKSLSAGLGFSFR